MSKNIFFTFPVQLLRGTFDNLLGVSHNAIDYAVFEKYTEVENIDEVENFFSIALCNQELSIANGQKLFEQYNGKGCPMVSLSRAILFDFHENHSKKTDFDKAVFLAYCGLRSVLGKKAYTKTNNEHLMARMAGFSTHKDFEQSKTKAKYFKEHFSDAQKIRYHLTDKIIRRELVLNWGLKYYANKSRGFYFSFVMEFEALVFEAEKARKSNRLRQQKNIEAEVIKRVKAMLKS